VGNHNQVAVVAVAVVDTRAVAVCRELHRNWVVDANEVVAVVVVVVVVVVDVVVVGLAIVDGLAKGDLWLLVIDTSHHHYSPMLVLTPIEAMVVWETIHQIQGPELVLMLLYRQYD
jgi:hypothetical protein